MAACRNGERDAVVQSTRTHGRHAHSRSLSLSFALPLSCLPASSSCAVRSRFGESKEEERTLPFPIPPARLAAASQGPPLIIQNQGMVQRTTYREDLPPPTTPPPACTDTHAVHKRARVVNSLARSLSPQNLCVSSPNLNACASRLLALRVASHRVGRTHTNLTVYGKRKKNLLK